MSTVRKQINRDGWWSSKAPTRDELPWECFWDDVTVQNLSKVSPSEILHVQAVHCAAIQGDRGQPTVRIVLDCLEGIYYRDSYDFVSQLQMMLDWDGPVEDWPPIKIDRPNRRYKRYRILPQG